jgi:hypothetical protein
VISSSLTRVEISFQISRLLAEEGYEVVRKLLERIMFRQLPLCLY